MTLIHPSATIHGRASVHPTAVVGPECVLAAGCVLGPYAIVEARTALGPDCIVHSFAVIGAAPQDRRERAQSPGRLVCGADNVFREGVTISRGTEHGGGSTRIGAGNLFMAHSHVGHDSSIGDHCTLANGVSLAGHVDLGDRVSIGGHAAVHQFARIGRLAFIAANAMVSKDVPPFCMAAGDRARLVGLNSTGLRRAAFSAELRSALKGAYRRLLQGTCRSKEANGPLESTVAEVRELARFIRESERGITRSQRLTADG